MEIVGVAALIAAILAFGLLLAWTGARYVSGARRHGRPVRALPTWYIGGQPDVAAPPPDGEGHGSSSRPGPHVHEARSPHTHSTDASERSPKRVES